jgi:hypothetical protein
MIGKAFKHFSLVMRHKWAVFIHCCKCGIPFRGLVHDLSKFTPTEFFESVKYYHGARSPLAVCREEKGMSMAWLHHKGRNKHHLEYWVDEDCKVPPLVPYKYAVECVCDKLAATKTYRGKDYQPDMALAHFRRYGNKVHTNERTLAFIDKVFSDLCELGEKAILNKKYMKATYAEICLSKEDDTSR